MKCQCCPHKETSQLICRPNQLTGFYMRATPALDGLKGLWRVSKSNRFNQKHNKKNIWFSKVAHVMNKVASVCSYKRRWSTTSLVNTSKALKEIERGQGFTDTSRKYAGARYTISHWNHNVTTRNAVETLMNFSLTPGSEKMQSLIVEISKLIESELLVNLTQALITVFLRK